MGQDNPQSGRHRPLLAVGFGLLCALLLILLCWTLGELWLRQLQSEQPTGTFAGTIKIRNRETPIPVKAPLPAPLPEVAPAKGPRPEAPPPQPVSQSTFYRDHPQLGFSLAPSAQVKITKRHQEEVIYAATYTTDSHGRRVCPDTKPVQGDGIQLLFFGCSYTFGDGVNDTESLPNQVAGRMHCSVSNYGIPGTGPQHMLEILGLPESKKELKGRRACLIYTLLHEHINRAVGTPRIVDGYGKRLPWYEIDLKTDSLVRRGLFSQRPGRPKSMSRVIQTVTDYHGETVTRDDAHLTVRILLEAKKRFESICQPEGFVVILFPGRSGGFSDAMAGWLRKGGTRVLDYRRILGTDIDHSRYFFPHDGHPRPETYALVAERLAQDLKLP